MTVRLVLPQHVKSDPLLQKRKARLAKMREAYAFDFGYRGAIATIKTLPAWEEACICYQLSAFRHLFTLIFSVPKILWAFLVHGLLKRPFSSYQSYKLFQASPLPDRAFAQNFLDDRYMGLQRVAGMNPALVEGLRADRQLTPQFYESVALRDRLPASIPDLIAQNLLYVTDYAMLQPFVERAGTFGTAQKYLTAPLVLYLLGADGHLIPVAVQLERPAPGESAGPRHQVITPDDHNRWTAARFCAQAADGTHHELWSHATRIHYLMESIIMVTWRQLSEDHPLFALLKPHLAYTLSVNVNPLFEAPPGGDIPMFGKMFGCDYNAMLDFMAEGMKSFDFKQAALPRDLARRHVEDPKLDYPYRDDGLLYWQAIGDFVQQFVGIYYPDAATIRQDDELQAWAAELARPTAEHGCGIPNFPGCFDTVEQLVETLTTILWIVTAHHSGVHFGQYEYAGLVPNMPFSVYAPPPSIERDYATLGDKMKLLPPFAIAFYQMFIFYLTNFRVNHVGDYNLRLFDGPATEAILSFRARLKVIEAIIADRNEKRAVPYRLMVPSRVPNSVSI